MDTDRKSLIFKTTEKILELAGVEAQFTITENDGQTLVNINAPNAGILIGRQGQNLKALERVLQVIFHEQDEGNNNVFVDVAGFKEKRMETISNLADQAIEEVLATNSPRILTDLTPSERKAVHLKIAEIGGVTSVSEGTRPNRILKILPSSEKGS